MNMVAVNVRQCIALGGAAHCATVQEHLHEGGASAWENVVGGAQDFNVSLRMLYGDEQWVLHSVHESQPVRLWIENLAKRKTQRECVPWTAH
jgi:hypothetical protein